MSFRTLRSVQPDAHARSSANHVRAEQEVAPEVRITNCRDQAGTGAQPLQEINATRHYRRWIEIVGGTIQTDRVEVDTAPTRNNTLVRSIVML